MEYKIVCWRDGMHGGARGSYAQEEKLLSYGGRFHETTTVDLLLLAVLGVREKIGKSQKLAWLPASRCQR